VTWEADVVKKGEPFTGRATDSVTAPVGVNAAADCDGGIPGIRSCFELPFKGLTDDGTYSFAMRMRDQLGAVTMLPGERETGDGWWTSRCWEFTKAP